MKNKMANLQRLITTAKNSARLRGHTLGDFQYNKNNDRAIAYCDKCNSYFQVIENPAPNEIDISGPAVAVNCTVGE